MSQTLGMVAVLAVPAFFLVYMGFKLDDRHAAMRMFLVSWAWIFLLGVPVVGSSMAAANSLEGVKRVFDIALLPMVFGFVFWVFYLLWLYISDAFKSVNKPGKEFSNEM